MLFPFTPPEMMKAETVTLFWGSAFVRTSIDFSIIFSSIYFPFYLNRKRYIKTLNFFTELESTKT